MSLLWIVYEGVVCLSEAVVAFLLFRRQLGIDKPKLYIALGLLPLIAVGTMIMNHMSLHWAIVTGVNVVVFTLYSSFLFGGSLTRRIIWGVTPHLIFCVSDFIISFVMTLTQRGESSITPSTGTRAIALLLYMACNFAIMLLLFTVKPREGFIPPLLRYMPVALIALGIAALLYHANQLFELEALGVSVVPCGIANAMILLLCAGLLLLSHFLSQIYQKNLDAQKELQQAKLEVEHIRQVEAMYRYVREWRHDMSGTLSTLSMLAKNNECGSIVRYIGEMDDAAQNASLLIGTGNPAIDATITIKLISAQKQHINVNSTLAIPENMSVDASDVCSVIMNLFDNAINAVVLLPEEERTIDFSMSVAGKMLKIRLFNPCDGLYEYENGRLATTKNKKSEHGVGLERVRHIAEKHSGYMLLKPLPETFEAVVLLQLV